MRPGRTTASPIAEGSLAIGSATTSRTVAAGGFDFHVEEAGSGDRLALCLHGFPELGYSWRDQLPVLAELGFRAWAPDLRGYGQTRPRPRRRRDYVTDALVEDVGALVDAAVADGADPEKTVVVGHDWGAALAWSFAINEVRPLERLVIMNVPHPELMLRSLRTFRQLRKSWYMFFFQLPWLPEFVLGRNDAEAIGKIFRDTAVHPDRFPDDVTAVYRQAASEPGALRAMINWYRSIPWGLRSALQQDEPTVATPTLLIWGEQDPALGVETTHGTEEFVGDLTVRYLPDASHWVQQDQPEVVNAMLAAFLRGEDVPEHDGAEALP